MWFFMNTCYFFTVLSFVMLILSGLQGYFRFFIFNANHATFALLTVIIYLFTETLVIFFFVGMGVSIRDYSQEKHLDQKFHRGSIKIKRCLYPPLLLNMTLVMILFISGGAVDTGHLPGLFHGILFYICILHFIKTIKIEHACFKENTSLVLEMSGIKRNHK